MAKKDFTTKFLVDRDPQDVFNTIQDVRIWWSGLFGEEFDGKAEALGDEFTYRAGEGAHYSKQKLVELDPGKKIAWLVTESRLEFLADKSEWTNTRICFEISIKGDRTLVRFTHRGLVPGFECYDVCSTVWTRYVQEKLLGRLTESIS